jgi:predicted dehydrogenase
MKKIQFGIIGCGVVSDIHAMALSDSRNAELAAVCDVNETAARNKGERYQVPYYTDYRELVRLPYINAVAVCTPSGLRGEIAVAAINVGKDVLMEKPMEITTEKITQISEAAHRNNVLAGVVLNSRYLPDSRRVLGIIQDGLLGKLISGSAYVKWYRKPEYYLDSSWRGTWDLDGGGALMNQSIHTIDLLLWYMGAAEKVAAFTGTRLHHYIKTEDSAVAAVTFKNGALGVIEGSTAVYPGFDARLEITGENGTVVLTNGIITTLAIKNDDKQLSFTTNRKESGSGAYDPAGISFEPHKLLIEDFSDCVTSRKPFWIDAGEASKSVALIRAIYKSAQSGNVQFL